MEFITSRAARRIGASASVRRADVPVLDRAAACLFNHFADKVLRGGGNSTRRGQELIAQLVEACTCSGAVPCSRALPWPVATSEAGRAVPGLAAPVPAVVWLLLPTEGDLAAEPSGAPAGVASVEGPLLATTPPSAGDPLPRPG